MFFGNLGALGRGCQHFPPLPPPSLLYRTWDETVNSFSQLASLDSGLQTLVSLALRHGDGKTGGNAFQRLDWRSEPGSPTQSPAQLPSLPPGEPAFESWYFVGTKSSPKGKPTWVAMESRFQSCPRNGSLSWNLSTLPLREQQALPSSRRESMKETQIIAIPLNRDLCSSPNQLVGMAPEPGLITVT